MKKIVILCWDDRLKVVHVFQKRMQAEDFHLRDIHLRVLCQDSSGRAPMQYPQYSILPSVQKYCRSGYILTLVPDRGD
jgi:hypothetical protein